MNKLLSIIALFMFSMNVNAQWVTNTAVNTEVSSYADNSMDIQSIGLNDGRTAVVFWEVVAAPTNFELRLQVMDAAGNKTLGVDGVLISDSIPMSTYTNTWTLTTDANNNLYIGVTGTNGAVGIMFKVNTQGTHLWPSLGIQLGSGYVVTSLPLSNGNTAVSWMNGIDGKAYMQVYDNAGMAVWSSNKTLASTSSWLTAPANLFELSNGDIVAFFHKRSYGINSTLYAQRYTSTGAYVWSNPTQLSTKTTAYNRLYSAAQSGDTCYIGYVGKANNRFDSYVQRVNPDGNIPWGANGLDFDISATNFEMDTRIAIENGSQYLWAVSTYTNTNQSQSGEYVQKFNMTAGTRMLTNTAKNLFPIGSEITHEDKLFVYDDKPFFIIGKGVDNGVSETMLDVIKLDPMGGFLWSDTSKAIASLVGTNKGQAQLNVKSENQSVIVFLDSKSGSSNRKIYAQNFMDTIVYSSSDAYMISYILPNQLSSMIYPNDSIVVIMPATSAFPIGVAAEFLVSMDATAFVGTVIQDSAVTNNTWNDSITPVVYTVTAQDGVTSKQYSVYVKVKSSVGIKNVNQKMSIEYNNPVKDLLAINSKTAINTVMVIDATGKVVFNQNNMHENSLRINTSKWTNGMYILLINSTNSYKIIKN